MPDREFDALPPLLTDHLGYLLVVLGKRAQRNFAAMLAQHHLRPPHFDVLATLSAAASPGVVQKDIANRLNIEPAQLVGLLDELQDFQYIQRTPDVHDRRRTQVTLTASGTKMLALLADAAFVVERELTQALAEEERTTLRALLQQLARAEPGATQAP